MEAVINVDAIINISIYPKTLQTKIEWMPGLPEKRKFFGLIKTQNEYPEGFYERGEYKRDAWGFSGGLVSEKYLNTSPLTIDWDEKKVYRLPYIEISFSNSGMIRKSFDTIIEANEYISNLQLASKNRFERIEY
jgi:hypothetical protein